MRSYIASLLTINKLHDTETAFFASDLSTKDSY
jgi:hypothetical protein